MLGKKKWGGTYARCFATTVAGKTSKIMTTFRPTEVKHVTHTANMLTTGASARKGDVTGRIPFSDIIQGVGCDGNNGDVKARGAQFKPCTRIMSLLPVSNFHGQS